jgi:hypothetical protein
MLALFVAAAAACGGDGTEPTPTSNAVATVEVTLGQSSLVENDVTTAQAIVRDAAGNALTKTVAWSSSAPDVATVSGGSITALKPGSAEISATVDGKSGKATATVVAGTVVTVTVTPAGSPTVIVDATVQLTATARDAKDRVLNGRTFVWQIDNDALATVASTGIVTALLPGAPKVSASVDGVSGSLTITINAPTLTRGFKGVSGHFGGYVEDFPDRVQYGWGYSFYSTVYPLKPNKDDWTQLGWGTWMLANPYEDENDVWSPRPADVCAPNASIPTLFQSNEGGIGSWGDIKFPTALPKYSIVATADCYSSGVGGPGYTPGGGTPLAASALYFAQLSNRILLPPDRVNVTSPSGAAVLGIGWIALPIIPAGYSPYGIPTGQNSWTLFFKATNFSGPVGFFTPAFWTSLDAAGAHSAGYGLDRRSAINTQMSLEVGFTPNFSATVDGVEYRRIPKMTFAADGNGRATLLQDYRDYSKAALWDGVATWVAGGSPVTEISLPGSRTLDFRLATDCLHMLDDDTGIDFSGMIKSAVGTNSGGGYWYGLEWGAGATAGTIPEYYKKVGATWVAIPESQVPRRTWLSDQVFPQLPRGTITPLSTTSGSPWASSTWAAGPFSATLSDGSVVDYVWYKFVDQPAIARLNLSESDKARIQAWVESLHGQSSLGIPGPTTGTLATIDAGHLVTPPAGLGVGYVPIVIAQH